MREVAAGEPVVVTSRGKPLVRIVPADEEDRREVERVKAEREQAFKELLAHLKTQPALNLGKITRDGFTTTTDAHRRRHERPRLRRRLGRP